MNTTRGLPRFRTPQIVVASFVLAAVAACGSTDDTKDDSASDTTPSATSPATTTSAPETNAQFEAYVDRVRVQSKDQMSRFDDVYSDFDVFAEGSDTLVYEYTFVNELDPATAETQIEATRSTLEGAAKPIYAEMEAAGVTDPKVRWTYKNPDGAELVSIQLP